MAERLSKGARKNIREDLARARRTGDSKTIASAESQALSRRRGEVSVNRSPSASQLISQIEERLQADTDTPEELAELSLRRVWLRFTSGLTNPGQRRTEQSELYDSMEMDNPLGLDWLNQKVGQDRDSGADIIRSSQIRDQILKEHPLR